MGGGKVPKHVCEEPPAFITPWQPSPGEEHSDFCSKKPPTHTFLAYPTIHHPTCWTVPPRWGVEKFPNMFVKNPQHSLPLGNPHLVRSIPTFAQKNPPPIHFLPTPPYTTPPVGLYPPDGGWKSSQTCL